MLCCDCSMTCNTTIMAAPGRPAAASPDCRGALMPAHLPAHRALPLHASEAQRLPSAILPCTAIPTVMARLAMHVPKNPRALQAPPGAQGPCRSCRPPPPHVGARGQLPPLWPPPQPRPSPAPPAPALPTARQASPSAMAAPGAPCWWGAVGPGACGASKAAAWAVRQPQGPYQSPARAPAALQLPPPPPAAPSAPRPPPLMPLPHPAWRSCWGRSPSSPTTRP